MTGPMRVHALLERLEINRESVLVIRGDTLVTGDIQLGDDAAAEAELASREARRPKMLSTEERSQILALGGDLPSVWWAPTTTDRDRKHLHLFCQCCR